MAGFKTHLTVSTTFGVAYGGAAYAVYGVPPAASVLAAGLCSVSGMLPDVDSDSGRPLRESLAFASAVVPMMLVDRFQRWGMSTEAIILAGVGLYLFIRFVLGEWLRHYTVHRGMFHSLPAAAVMGELAFLVTSSADLRIRWLMAGAVVIGYLSHLVLDEVYSVKFKYGLPRLKKSFGTALKLYSHQSLWANVSVYGKLILLTYLVIYDPGWMKQFPTNRVDQIARQAMLQLQHWGEAGTPRPEQPVANTAEQPAERRPGVWR